MLNSTTSPSRRSASDLARVRLLVVGDSGVGKTSLVHRLCHGTALQRPKWTVGCSTDVKLHRYSKGDREFFVEFLDVGGSYKYKMARQVFYTQLHGILLVFDVGNANSYNHLRDWIRELVDVDTRRPLENSAHRPPSSHRPSAQATMPKFSRALTSVKVAGDRAQSESRLGDLPIFVVGNKTDQNDGECTRVYNSLKDFGVEACFVSSLQWTHSHELDAFIERVIARRYYSSGKKRQVNVPGSLRSGDSSAGFRGSYNVARPRPRPI
eukprot:84403_1